MAIIEKMTLEINIDFKAIKKWLERGDIAALAKEHGIKPDTAYHILRGRKKNFEFLQAAIALALKRKNNAKKGVDELKAE